MTSAPAMRFDSGDGSTTEWAVVGEAHRCFTRLSALT